MRCIPSSVSHEVQTTRHAIKSFPREVEMLAEMFRGRFACQRHNRRCLQISFPSYICRLRLFQPPRKFCNVCRRTENVGQAVSEDHESALCPSSNAHCQSKGRRIRRTVFMTIGEDSNADIDICISFACAIELPSNFSKSFRSTESSTVAATKPFSQTTRRQHDRPGTSAAQQVLNKLRPRCRFCRLEQHPRSKCPADKDTCHKCSKAAHWASVCRSTAVVLQQSSDDKLDCRCFVLYWPAACQSKCQYQICRKQLTSSRVD